MRKTDIKRKKERKRNQSQPKSQKKMKTKISTKTQKSAKNRAKVEPSLFIHAIVVLIVLQKSLTSQNPTPPSEHKKQKSDTVVYSIAHQSPQTGSETALNFYATSQKGLLSINPTTLQQTQIPSQASVEARWKTITHLKDHFYAILRFSYSESITLYIGKIEDEMAGFKVEKSIEIPNAGYFSFPYLLHREISSKKVRIVFSSNEGLRAFLYDFEVREFSGATTYTENGVNYYQTCYLSKLEVLIVTRFGGSLKALNEKDSWLSGSGVYQELGTSSFQSGLVLENHPLGAEDSHHDHFFHEILENLGLVRYTSGVFTELAVVSPAPPQSQIITIRAYKGSRYIAVIWYKTRSIDIIKHSEDAALHSINIVKSFQPPKDPENEPLMGIFGFFDPAGNSSGSTSFYSWTPLDQPFDYKIFAVVNLFNYGCSGAQIAKEDGSCPEVSSIMPGCASMQALSLKCLKCTQNLFFMDGGGVCRKCSSSVQNCLECEDSGSSVGPGASPAPAGQVKCTKCALEYTLDQPSNTCSPVPKTVIPEYVGFQVEAITFNQTSKLLKITFKQEINITAKSNFEAFLVEKDAQGKEKRQKIEIKSAKISEKNFKIFEIFLALPEDLQIKNGDIEVASDNKNALLDRSQASPPRYLVGFPIRFKGLNYYNPGEEIAVERAAGAANNAGIVLSVILGVLAASMAFILIKMFQMIKFLALLNISLPENSLVFMQGFQKDVFSLIPNFFEKSDIGENGNLRSLEASPSSQEGVGSCQSMHPIFRRQKLSCMGLNNYGSVIIQIGVLVLVKALAVLLAKQFMQKDAKVVPKTLKKDKKVQKMSLRLNHDNGLKKKDEEDHSKDSAQETTLDKQNKQGMVEKVVKGVNGFLNFAYFLNYFMSLQLNILTASFVNLRYPDLDGVYGKLSFVSAVGFVLFYLVASTWTILKTIKVIRLYDQNKQAEGDKIDLNRYNSSKNRLEIDQKLKNDEIQKVDNQARKPQKEDNEELKDQNLSKKSSRSLTSVHPVPQIHQKTPNAHHPNDAKNRLEMWKTVHKEIKEDLRVAKSVLIFRLLISTTLPAVLVFLVDHPTKQCLILAAMMSSFMLFLFISSPFKQIKKNLVTTLNHSVFLLVVLCLYGVQRTQESFTERQRYKTFGYLIILLFLGLAVANILVGVFVVVEVVVGKLRKRKEVDGDGEGVKKVRDTEKRSVGGVERVHGFGAVEGGIEEVRERNWSSLKQDWKRYRSYNRPGGRGGASRLQSLMNLSKRRKKASVDQVSVDNESRL